MNLKRSNPPDLNSIPDLLTSINKALRVLQFLSGTNGALIAPSVLDVLDKFLPEFQRRQSLIGKLEENLRFLKLFAGDGRRIKIRGDIYEVNSSDLMRGKVAKGDTNLPNDDEMAEDCTSGLMVLRNHAGVQTASHGYLTQTALIEALEELLEVEDVGNVIPLLRQLDMYRLDWYDGEIACFVDQTYPQITTAMLKTSKAQLDWPAVGSLRQVFQAKAKGELSADEIVEQLIKIVERCEDRLQRQTTALDELKKEKNRLQATGRILSDRVEKLERALVGLEGQLPDGQVRQLLQERGISLPSGRRDG